MRNCLLLWLLAGMASISACAQLFTIQFMKQLLLVFLAFGFFALFSGCGQEAPKNEKSIHRDFGSVKLLTYRYLAQDKLVIDSFQQKYNIRVDIEVLSPAEMIMRAQRKELKGDLVLVPKFGDIVRMKSFGILQPFYVAAFSSGNVDDRYLDREGYYAGLSRWAMAAVYNPQAVAEGEVKTYRTLAQIPLRGIRMGMAHPDSSGFLNTVAGLSKVINPEGAALWAKVMMENAAQPLAGNDYDQLDRMLAGDLDMAFVSASAAIRWFLNGNPRHFAAAEAWRVIYPHTENDFLTVMDMTSVGVLADAPNRENALRLINHFFQQSHQESISEAIFEYPNEAFSLVPEILMNLSSSPTKDITADDLEDLLPFAYEVVNKVAEGL